MPKHSDLTRPHPADFTIPRRDFLQATLSAVVCYPLTVRNVRAFRLVEDTGLRRFGYPVHAIVPEAVEGRNFRLIRDGRVIPAQFGVVELEPGRRELCLDFVASPEPLEVQSYEVLFGPDVEPGPAPRSGLKVAERDGKLIVDQSSSLVFEFSESPGGFLLSAGSPRLAYLREGSGGLKITEKAVSTVRADQPPMRKPDSRTKVSREGPLAIGLRTEWSGPSGQPSTLDLTVPHSKSWVQGHWTIADPDHRIASVSLDLNLLIEGTPTLVDLGAGSTVYGQIKGQERMELEAGRGDKPADRWVVRQGVGEKPPTFAASKDSAPRPAEGWAHIMDARRCTAVAVADFGKNGNLDRITVQADGHLQLMREFAEKSGETKTLNFWLHFVPMPVQVGAATSPQSILAPLRVEWDR